MKKQSNWTLVQHWYKNIDTMLTKCQYPFQNNIVNINYDAANTINTYIFLLKTNVRNYKFGIKKNQFRK